VRVRDTFKNFCDLCWIGLVLTGSVWVLMAVLLIISLFAGAWPAASFFGLVVIAYGGMLALVSYLEARSHWKRGDLT
jgi:uncharacterized membrane protein